MVMLAEHYDFVIGGDLDRDTIDLAILEAGTGRVRGQSAQTGVGRSVGPVSATTIRLLSSLIALVRLTKTPCRVTRTLPGISTMSSPASASIVTKPAAKLLVPSKAQTRRPGAC